MLELAELYYRPDGKVHPDRPMVPVTFRFPDAAMLRQAGTAPEYTPSTGGMH